MRIVLNVYFQSNARTVRRPSAVNVPLKVHCSASYAKLDTVEVTRATTWRFAFAATLPHARNVAMED